MSGWRIPYIRGDKHYDIFHGRYAPLTQLSDTSYVPVVTPFNSGRNFDAPPENKGFFPNPSGFTGMLRDDFLKLVWRVKSWRLSGTFDYDISINYTGALVDTGHITFTANVGGGWTGPSPGVTPGTSVGLIVPAYITGTGANHRTTAYGTTAKEFQFLDLTRPLVHQFHSTDGGRTTTGSEINPPTYANATPGDLLFQERGLGGWFQSLQTGVVAGLNNATLLDVPTVTGTHFFDYETLAGIPFGSQNANLNSNGKQFPAATMQMALFGQLMLTDHFTLGTGGFPYNGNVANGVQACPLLAGESANKMYARGHNQPQGVIYVDGGDPMDTTTERYYPHVHFAFTSNEVVYYDRLGGALVPMNAQVRTYRKNEDASWASNTAGQPQVGTFKILNTSDPTLHTGTSFPLYLTGINSGGVNSDGSLSLAPTNFVASFELRPIEWWPFANSAGASVYNTENGELVDPMKDAFY